MSISEHELPPIGDNETRRDPRFDPPTNEDWVIFFVGLLIAAVLTVPPTLLALREIQQAPVVFTLVVSLWNAWYWVLPGAWSLIRWRAGMLAGVDDHWYLIREFGVVQFNGGILAVIFSPILVGTLFYFLFD